MLYRSPAEAGAALHRPVVAIGNFDGVHRGHRAVISQAVEIAARTDVDTAVLTFEPHPVRFFRPDTPPFRLTTLEQKSEQLHRLGVDGVVAATFDGSMANLDPEAFVTNVLDHGLHASCVLVGADFQFGKGRAGDVDTLRELGQDHGFDVAIIEQVTEDDVVISSTAIRSALRDGDLDRANHLLGRHYAIVGEVIVGDQKGREYGFPTANLSTPNPVLPPDGIYATILHDEEYGQYAAATYVGTRPTVQGTTRNVEAYCLDTPESFDLYGHQVELEFVAKVRGDEKFDSVDAMIEQMHHDVARARELLAR